MTWEPIPLPTGPIAKSESETEGRCGWCESPDGEPCRTTECGTYDYDDAPTTK